MTTLRVSEIFHSLQGEGTNVGVPCSFLRLAGCNLSCGWCDSKYTWDFDNYDYDTEVSELSLDQIAEQLRLTTHLVITGGEPMLQHKRLPPLLSALKARTPQLFVEMETNGTLAPTAALADVDQWNVSPKLGHAGDPLSRRLVRPALQAFRQQPNALLKFVVEAESDLEEIAQIVAQLDWPKKRVLLMPQARTPAELNERLAWLAGRCVSAGYRLSPRLHIEIWGDRRGV